MATGQRPEAFGAYYFQVDLNVEGVSSETPIPFRSCSGLRSESQVVELEEGGFNLTTRKLIGRTKYPNLTLKHGFCHANSLLWQLRMKFMNDQPGGEAQGTKWRGPSRFNGTIKQLGPNGTMAEWAFFAAWICKWEGPEFDASKNEISIETIEIAHEGLLMMPVKNNPNSPGKGGGGVV